MNPPYQASNDKGGSKTHASPLYNLFIETIIDALLPAYLVSINPSRWMVGGRGLDKFRQRMMADRRMKTIVHFPGSFSVFPSVKIDGGVNYFLWDRSYDGKCEFVVENTVSHRYLDTYDIVLQDNNAVEILEKVKRHCSSWMDKSWAIQTPFGIHTSYKDWREKGVPCYSSGKEINFCGKEAFTDKLQIRKKWKVLIGEAFGESGTESFRVIGVPFIIEPGAICTQTYIVVNVFDSKEEASNFVSYMKTRFFRFMLWLRKATQHINRNKLAWVPDVEDYTTAWTDKELYDMFGLTRQERSYIESKIKVLTMCTRS